MTGRGLGSVRGTVLALMLAAVSAASAAPTADWRNETPAAKAERLRWWTDARFGMFIHYGLYALPARVSEWIRTRERMSDAQYDVYRRHFNPDLFDAREWARIAKRTGMKYAVLTAKHHDGFCLWDAKGTDFKITNTPFGRDLVREFVEAFRAEGLRVGLYYSLKDWNHPDFTIDHLHPKRPAGKGLGGAPAPDSDYDRLNDGRDMARYRQYMKDQTRELLTQYGKIDIFWFDYSYPSKTSRLGKGRAEWDSEGLLALARSLQPQLIVDNRLDLDDTTWGWDFLTPEQRKVPEWPTLGGVRQPWETCWSFSGAFGYNRDQASWRSSHQLLELLSDTVSKGGNLLLNVGPTARGTFDDRAMGRLDDIGAWMRLNGRSIYGCTAAPDDFKAPEGTALTWNPTARTLYLHLYDYPLEFVPLEFWDRIELAQFLHDASEVKVVPARKAQPGDVDEPRRNRGGLQLPTLKPQVEIPVVEIFLKEPKPFPAFSAPRAITSGPHDHFFASYFGINSWSPDNRYALVLETDLKGRLPDGAPCTLGLVDTQDGNRFIPVTTTRCWNFQEAAMAHWLPNEPDTFVFNDLRDGRFCAVVLNWKTKAERVYPHPVSAVSADGTWALSINYARLYLTRPDYGYALEGQDPRRGVVFPEDDGLWRLDLRTGAAQLIVPTSAVKAKVPSVPSAGLSYLCHTVISKDDARVYFLSRSVDRSLEGVKTFKGVNWQTTAFTCRADGSEIRRCFPDGWGSSHFNWKSALTERDARTMTVTCAWQGKTYTHVEFTVGEEEKVRRIAGPAMDFDGHCIYSPDGAFVSGDGYWDRNFERHWKIVRLADGAVRDIGSFFIPEAYRDVYSRCDLHPRWRPDGRQLGFNSVHEGSRQVYVMDVP